MGSKQKFMAVTGRGITAREIPLEKWRAVMKFLRGATVRWEDKKPLYEVGTVLEFAFDTKTRAGADIFIARVLGVPLGEIENEIARLLAGVRFTWHCHVEVLYTRKNRPDGDKLIVRPVDFKFTGTINPICGDYMDRRDKAFFAAQLSEQGVPEDSKNKGEYLTTRFTLTLL
jgi:hypothetical protein